MPWSRRTPLPNVSLLPRRLHFILYPASEPNLKVHRDLTRIVGGRRIPAEPSAATHALIEAGRRRIERCRSPQPQRRIAAQLGVVEDVRRLRRKIQRDPLLVLEAAANRQVH